MRTISLFALLAYLLLNQIVLPKDIRYQLNFVSTVTQIWYNFINVHPVLLVL
jgi:hypothetical protein